MPIGELSPRIPQMNIYKTIYPFDTPLGLFIEEYPFFDTPLGYLQKNIFTFISLLDVLQKTSR